MNRRRLSSCLAVAAGLIVAPLAGYAAIGSSSSASPPDAVAASAGAPAGTALTRLTGELAGKAPDARDLIDELLHMFACKAAVKFGYRLSPGEIDALLAQRHLAQDPHHCPHGRPTALVFTREQLDRQFKRI